LLVLALLLCGVACGDETLLADSARLKKTVTAIVTPYLHHAATEEASDDDPKAEGEAKRPPNRAWAIVVGIVSKDHREVFGFGRFSAQNDQQPDAKTLFEIGSVTKTFTALLLAERVEQGKLKLDDPVQNYLPDSVAMPKRGDHEITLLHLATHTSALPRIPRSIGLIALISSDPYKNYTEKDLYKTLGKIELSRDPGEEFEYSNLGFGLLGHLLSRQAGRPYEELLRERICKPLGLDETRIELDDEHRQRLAPPHNALGVASSTWEFDALAGAGAIRSTADDMLRYLEANMGLKETPLLSAMRLCHRPRHQAGHAVQSIGLGWHIEKVPGRPALVFHGGGTGGYTSLVGFTQPDAGPAVGVVVLANTAPSNSGMAANDIAVKLLAALREPPRDP
jgi:CubicO group peptidase (beta-lactamase class C family)